MDKYTKYVANGSYVYSVFVFVLLCFAVIAEISNVDRGSFDDDSTCHSACSIEQPAIYPAFFELKKTVRTENQPVLRSATTQEKFQQLNSARARNLIGWT